MSFEHPILFDAGRMNEVDSTHSPVKKNFSQDSMQSCEKLSTAHDSIACRKHYE